MCVIVSTQFTHSLEVYIKSTVSHLWHIQVSLFCVAYERVSFQVVTGGTQVEIWTIDVTAHQTADTGPHNFCISSTVLYHHSNKVDISILCCDVFFVKFFFGKFYCGMDCHHSQPFYLNKMKKNSYDNKNKSTWDVTNVQSMNNVQSVRLYRPDSFFVILLLYSNDKNIWIIFTIFTAKKVS